MEQPSEGTGWRLAVIRGYIWFSIVLSAAMVVMPLLVAPLVLESLPVILVMVTSTMLYGALQFLAYRVPATWGALRVLVPCLMFCGSVATMVVLPTRQISVIASLLIVPAAAGFLGHRRWVPAAWVVTSITCLVVTWWDSGFDVTQVDNVAGIADGFAMVALLTVVSGLTWVVESERERWHQRALLQRRELTDALEDAQVAAAEKSRFLATMSHEIRTPMNGVLGLTDTLLASDLDASQRELIQTVQDSGRVLQHILNDILDFSRLESSEVMLDPRPTRVRNLVDQVASLHHSAATDKGLRLWVAVTPHVPEWGLVDDARLSQILVNLVSNAVKFTESGEVGIRVDHDGLRLRFEVLDTGIGVDPDRVERLFQPFVQAEASTHRRFGGTGLGLAICARLVACMGGRVGAEPRSVGSRFWVELPFEAVSGWHESEESSLLELGRLRVLVAEDHPVNRLVAEKTLEQLGVDATFVPDGAQAVEAVRTGTWDIVLMDCQMPVMDGFVATERIRALGYAQLPIVALTASATEADRERALEVGMNDVVTKPIDRRALGRALARWTAPSVLRKTG